MTNYELQAKFKAGLLLVGQDEDGALEWMGENHQFFEADRLIEAFEDEGTPIIEIIPF